MLCQDLLEEGHPIFDALLVELFWGGLFPLFSSDWAGLTNFVLICSAYDGHVGRCLNNEVEVVRYFGAHICRWSIDGLYEMKIAVAGIGYVGLSNAILFAQNHEVVAVDISENKVQMLNDKKSPIVDDEIEDFLATRALDLTATADGASAYLDADFVVVATPNQLRS